MGEKYWSYQDPFIGNANILAVQAMLQGSLQWTIGTQVKLALSLGKILAVWVRPFRQGLKLCILPGITWKYFPVF